MRNRPLLLLALASIAASGTALSTPSAVKAEEWGIEIGLRSGFRQDDIHFEGDNAFGGTAIAELSNTKVHHLELFGRAIIKEGFYYRGSIALGWYYDGDLFVAEDGDDGALGTFPLGIRPYQVVGEVSGERLFDVTGGVGYQFSLFDDRLQLAPLGGYSFHKNNVKTDSTLRLQIDEGLLFFDEPGVGFDTEWRGPWVGFDASGWITPQWSVLAEFEYHWVDFNGKQRLYTQRSDPKTGDGGGVSWSVATRYSFGKHFTGELLYRRRSWTARTARSLDVTWDSSLITAGLIFLF